MIIKVEDDEEEKSNMGKISSESMEFESERQALSPTMTRIPDSIHPSMSEKAQIPIDAYNFRKSTIGRRTETSNLETARETPAEHITVIKAKKEFASQQGSTDSNFDESDSEFEPVRKKKKKPKAVPKPRKAPVFKKKLDSPKQDVVESNSVRRSKRVRKPSGPGERYTNEQVHEFIDEMREEEYDSEANLQERVVDKMNEIAD